CAMRQRRGAWVDHLFRISDLHSVRAEAAPLCFSSFTPNSSAASFRWRNIVLFVGAFLSIHSTALSYHRRALSLFPNCQLAMARKKELLHSASPVRSSRYFSSAAIASVQLPARYCATPSVFQPSASLGSSSRT